MVQLLPYEWNTGAEQTGVSSINEPIMIISNDQLSSTTMSRGWTHICGKLRCNAFVHGVVLPRVARARDGCGERADLRHSIRVEYRARDRAGGVHAISTRPRQPLMGERSHADKLP